MHLWITGRVQGIGFRWRARMQAQALGLAGWVRNLPDGRVEAAVEGPAAAVQEFVLWCQEGPAGGWVERVDMRSEPLAGETGFQIR
ncbi:MAG: acylphosphatase [Firmicutes bacterium]|nr:acylphosphatase [Bacillota bacterium]